MHNVIGEASRVKPVPMRFALFDPFHTNRSVVGPVVAPEVRAVLPLLRPRSPFPAMSPRCACLR